MKMDVKSVKTVEKVNVDNIAHRYKELLKDVETKDFYKKDLTNRVNCYVCQSCSTVTKTKDIAAGTTPFTIRCKSCGSTAFSTMYKDEYPEVKPTVEWYRPNLKELMTIKNNNIIDHVLNGGLLSRDIDPYRPLLTKEETEELDEEFMNTEMFKEMKKYYLKQRGLKKFRNPMTHLTPKKKKRKK